MHFARKLASVFLFTAASTFAQTITTVAGGGTTYLANNVPATYANLYGPSAVAVDQSGNYYFADYNPSSSYGTVIYKVSVNTNTITIVAGTGAFGYTGDGGQATNATLSNQVYGLTVAPSGNIYISDSLFAVIRKVTVSTGVITTFAGSNPTKAAYAGGYNGDGGQATSAFLHGPAGIYTTGSGLYIADAANSRVRYVNGYGIISTVAGNGTSGYTGDGGQATSAEIESPSGVSLDSAGNIYITDQGVSRNEATVRKVNASTGVITTFAGGVGQGPNGDGGLATNAGLTVPKNLTLDSSGNVYIADTYDNLVRKVAASTGIITTFAGNLYQGFSGDGGPATNAEMYLPYGVAIDTSNNVYIADQRNVRIRKVH